MEENSNNSNKNRISKQKNFNLPLYTLFEEILNSITHGLGVIFAVVAVVMLFGVCPKETKYILCIGIYCISLFILYIISTLYHALGICYAKKVFRVLDHCSIFLLIAGTYTPIGIIVIGGPAGYIIVALVWSMAIFGIILNSINLQKFARLSLVCYIIMGWTAIFAIKPLLENMTPYQLQLLFIGGAAYTLGALLYVIGKKIKYIHSVWHLLVLAGSILHFMMIYDAFKLQSIILTTY